MPHLIIEYSDNVAEHHNIDELVKAIHDDVVGMEVGPLAGMRSRAAARSAYRVADGDPNYAFIAIAARIGPGRDGDTKKALIQTILDAGQGQIGESPLLIAWSAEVQEIDAEFRENRNLIKPHLTAKLESAG